MNEHIGDPPGPVVTWTNKNFKEIPPPADRDSWVRAIASVSKIARVVLVWDGSAQWWVSTAEQLQVVVGPGPWTPEQMAPIDLREKVKAALRAAGKPIRD
jgi:hypothetical protein